MTDSIRGSSADAANRYDYDYAIIGGGIVGLATAWALLKRRPGSSLVVLEKEHELAVHQTGHNSGVIHAGIYYAPGSLKAQLCRAGAAATKAFATEHGIPFEECGKLLVATDAVELERMQALIERAAQNGIEAEVLDAATLREREPHVSGVGALYLPETGIIDYRLVSARIADLVRESGGTIELGVEIASITESAQAVVVSSGSRSWTAKQVIACAGLQADRVAQMARIKTDFQIMPFRGEYFELPKSRVGLVKHLIYPIPDPDLPFLGVHLSPTIDGGLTVGPNAVLGLAREKYPKLSVNVRDVLTMLRFPGLWRVASANLKTGVREMKNSLLKRGYLKECQKYCPELTLSDLQPREAGIRAQAVMNDGTFVHDFLFRSTARTLHVVNAPSPAATSAFPIGEMIADRVLEVGAATGPTG